MSFPFEEYETRNEQLKIHYPTGEESQASLVLQTIDQAHKLLAKLLNQVAPEMEVLLVASKNWENRPREVPEEQVELAGPGNLLPYWTDSTSPSSLVIPVVPDPIIGEPEQDKLAFLLYHEVTRAFLE